MRVPMCALLVLAMVAAGCSHDDDDAATPTATSPGSDEVATTASADFEVAFDGEACTLTGPESVPAGEDTFVLTDTSEFDAALFVDVYADGYTWTDHDNYIEEAGGDGDPVDRPDWVSQAVLSFGVPDLELEENQAQSDYSLEAGSHGIVVVPFGVGVWRCAGLEVT